MPVLRVTYTRPDRSLPPAQELGCLITEAILSTHELNRWSDQLREMFRVRLHEMPQDHFLLGGRQSDRGLYDIEYILPAGTLSPDVRDKVSVAVCRCVLEWEGLPWDERDAMRVMLVITEVAHDRWYWGGRPVTPRTIVQYLGRLRQEARKWAGAAVDAARARESA